MVIIKANSRLSTVIYGKPAAPRLNALCVRRGERLHPLAVLLLYLTLIKNQRR
jgi:hypothetical protein